MKVWVLPLLMIMLNACSQENQQPDKNEVQVIVSTAPDAQTDIIKSVIDTRSYASIVLENKLEVLLVSDPTIEKSAAALSVAAGSFQEPKGFGGLAHYLEHMLFLGTKSYPTVGEYNEFITRNGGSQNAYTQLDHTNYMIAVNNDQYDEALKRFSGFFYESLLDETYAEKEKNAVHSEWTMKGPHDFVILGQLDGTTLNAEHPIHQFNWGNLESLSDKEDQKLQTVLVEFYNKYYSANIMKASMISNLPIDEMKQLAKKHFGLITNKNIPAPVITEPVAKAGQLKKVIHYIPQTDMKEIHLKFVIDNNVEQFAVKPNHYVSYMIGNEMSGTVAHTLREMGLTDSLSAYANADEYGNAGSMTIRAVLTEKGLQHRDQIVGLIFKYIKLLKEKGVDKKYYTEIKQTLSNAFRFKEKTNDYRYAMNIAADLQKYPTNYVLSSAYEYQRFQADAITSVLNQMTINNARVFYIDKDQPTDTDMHFFKGKYKLEPISDEMVSQWVMSVNDISLNLPTPNSLMPDNFDIVESTHSEKPVTLIDEERLSLYLANSKMFSQPKGYFIANFNTGYATASPRQTVISSLLSRGLELSLTTLKDEASLAGMGLQFDNNNGLELTATGFTDKQGILLEKAYKHMLDFSVSDDELKNLKAHYHSEMKSKKKQILLDQLFPKFSKIINLDQFSDESLLAEVDSISTSDITKFRDQLLELARLNIFAFGNYSDETAIKMARFLKKLLPEQRKLNDIYYSKRYQPKPGSVVNWQEDVEMTDIALVDAFFIPFDVNKHAASRILSKILQPALYKQIRTEEQLGYVVGFFNQPLREQLLMGFYIQSPAKGPDAVAKRIDIFKQGFVTKLSESIAERFETIRNSELITLTQPPKNLREELAPFSNDWRQQKLEFNSRSNLIAAIKEVTIEDVTSLYTALVSGKEFGRVVVQLRGTKFNSEPFAEHKSAEKIKDVNNFHSSLKEK